MLISFVCLFEINKSQTTSLLILISFCILLISSIFNHNKVLNIVYPRNIKEHAQRISNDFEEISSLSGRSVHKLERRDTHKAYSLVNAQWLVPPITNSVENIPKGNVLLKSLHPYSSFPPYLFLHYNSEERTIIQNKDLEMLFIHKYEW